MSDTTDIPIYLRFCESSLDESWCVIRTMPSGHVDLRGPMTHAEATEYESAIKDWPGSTVVELIFSRSRGTVR